MGNGKDDVEIFRIQDFTAALIDPELLQDRLAVRAVSVAAGRIMDLNMPALIADAGIDAEVSGLAVFDGIGRAELLCGNRMLLQKTGQRPAEDAPDRIGFNHNTPSLAETGWDWDTSSDSRRTVSHR